MHALRRLILVVAGLAVFGISWPAAAAVPPFTHESWADATHGWATDGGNVYGTEDGGRSWRLVLRTGSYDVQPSRTSVRSGLVSSVSHSFVTIDGGRHWYFARSKAALDTAIGSGRLVFTSPGQTIERLVGWPPRRLRCRTRWIGDPTAIGRGPAPRNICDAPVVVTVRSRPVYRLQTGPNDEIELAALVPGGVAGFVWTDCGEFCNEALRVLVYRNGIAHLDTLTDAKPGGSREPGSAKLTVNWPRLVVTDAAGGYWYSNNDGGDWHVGG